MRSVRGRSPGTVGVAGHLRVLRPPAPHRRLPGAGLPSTWRKSWPGWIRAGPAGSGGPRPIPAWPATAYQAWWARYLRAAASPSMGRGALGMNAELDIRHLLPQVAVPTLVIHRTNEQWVDVGNGRYLAAHIDGAQLIERPAWTTGLGCGGRRRDPRRDRDLPHGHIGPSANQARCDRSGSAEPSGTRMRHARCGGEGAGHRGCAGPQRAHRGEPSRPRLRQARRAVQARTGPAGGSSARSYRRRALTADLP